MTHRRYSPESLGSALLQFESTFGMDSDTFYARHLANELADVPRYERAVWATFYEERRRMTDAPVMDRVSSTFAFA